MELIRFLYAEQEALPEQEIIVSKRFQDENGPVAWQITAIGAKQWRSLSMRKDKWSALAACCVTRPNLQDKKLQESYGAKEETELLKRMLRAGEYLFLLEKVKEINGFQKRRERLYRKAKN